MLGRVMRRITWIVGVALALACSPKPTTKPPTTTAAVAETPSTTPPDDDRPARPSTGDPVVDRIIDLGTRDSKVDAHLHHLAKVIGPRLTGSHNLMIAEKWARDQFASFGLDAKLEKWGEFPIGFDRGPWSGAMVTPEKKSLEITTRAWTPGVFGPVKGPAVPYPSSVAEVKKDPARFAGAWVIHPDTSKGPRRDEKLLTAIDDALFAAKIAGHVERARDPKGVLVHTSGKHQIEWSALPRDVRVILRGDQHDDLVRRLGSAEKVELEFSIDNRFFRGPVPQHNVVADLVGSELPNELVIVGGHIDSWDGAEGAVDNATGCATTLEAARLLVAAGAKPKRTIRFMLWSGEEQGLLGSEAYVAQHPELVDNTSVVLVHDGGTNFLSGLRVTPEMAEDAKKVFAPVMDLDPNLPFALFYADALRKGGSDHGPFIDKGIPGFFWEQDGRADYDHSHHTQFDTTAFAIPEYQKHSAMVVAIAALGFANLESKLDRTDSPALPRRQIGADLDGAVVKSVTKGSAGAKAGLEKGDEIVAVEGEGGSPRQMLRKLGGDGTTRQVAVMRGGKRIELVIDFAGEPAEVEREARRKRRKERFGDLDYDKPFAGRVIEKPKPTAEAPPAPPAG
jgi:carboxypeptidase Q